MPKINKLEPKKLLATEVATSKQRKKSSDRPVIYPDCVAEVRKEDLGTAITADYAKELLGWQEEPEGGKWGSDYLIKVDDKKIRCVNNVNDGYTNRPIYESTIAILQQEILNRRWRYNGESIIIGKTGLVLNGQHTLIGLILAVNEWLNNNDKWKDLWVEEPTIDKLIAFGVDEDDSTANTMDTCKPRSLADVIYRSNLFKELKESYRKKAARMADNAIRLIWSRTGAGLSAFAPRRTHAESLAFLERHPKLLDCVRHVMEEEGKAKRVSSFIPPGYASGMMYLMGCSTSDQDAYHTDQTPREDLLDWANWNKALTFITRLAANQKDVAPVRTLMGRLAKEGLLSTTARCSVLVNAWACFVEEQPITEEEIDLVYGEDDEGRKVIADFPVVGGIDIGDPRNADENIIRANDPKPEEIEEEKASRKQTKLEKKASKVPAKTHRAGDEWNDTDVAWVYDAEGEHFMAVVVGEPYECDDEIVRVMVRSNDGEWEVDVENLSLEKPDPVEKKESPKMRKGKKGDKEQKAETFKKGSVVWVKGPNDDEAWQGKIEEIGDKSARMKVNQGFQGAGTIKIVPVSTLSKTQPR